MRPSPAALRLPLTLCFALLACNQQGVSESVGVQPGGVSPAESNQTGGGAGGQGNVPLVPAGPGGNVAVQPNVATTPNVVPQQPNGPAVQFLGRFDTATDPNLHTMAWPSSQLLVGFEGTRLVVTLDSLDNRSYNGQPSTPYVAGSVDGGASTVYKLTSGRAQYAVAQNLPVGHHTVRLTLRTEAQIGRVGYVSATTDGSLSYTPSVAARRLEIVGDSGACGYGADGNFLVNGCTFSAATENGEVAYPNLVGQLLGAEVRNLSYSGKGLVENRDMVDDAYKTLPVLWQRTLPYDDPDAAWDTNAWRPQAVVLITGGNDFANEIPAATTYVNTVAAFVSKLKAVYPGVVVFLGLSPMLRDDGNPNPTDSKVKRATAATYMRQVVTQASDANVRYLDIPGPDTNDPNSALGANGYGCDQHPTAGTHRKVAASIAATLKAQLGW